MPSSEFPFIGGEPLSHQRKPRKEIGSLLRARDPNAGKLIFFVIGGLTKAEVYGL